MPDPAQDPIHPQARTPPGSSWPDTSRGSTRFLGRLRVRLILLVLVSFLPALVLVIYNAVEQRRIGLEDAKQNAFRLAHLASARQDDLLRNGSQLLMTLAQLREVRRLEVEACEAIFTNLLRLHPAYANIGIILPNGDVLASGIPFTQPVNVADRSYFRGVTNTLAFTVGDFQVGRISGKSSLNLAYPILGNSGRLVGIVSAALDLEWLYNLFSKADLPPGSSYTVYDRDHVTLARFPDPNREYVGQRIGPEPRSRPPDDAGLDRPVDRTMVLTGRDGIRRLYATTRLGEGLENSVRITFGIPVSVAFAESNRLLKRNLLLLASATALAFLAAWFGGHFLILRRVNGLLEATRRLHGGDLSARTGETSARGELEQLALAFDQMAGQLEKQFAERKRAEADLKSLNEDLEERVTVRTHQLKRSNEDLEQFAYVASHDLQEPLRMITSYLALLKQRYHNKLDANANDFIGFAVDGADRMHHLINDLLAYSRVQTKAQPFHPVSCNEVLDRVLENLQIALRESGAQILREPLPAIQGDTTQLTQLFQNLLSNALKFRGDRPPEVRIQARQQDGHWLFSVQDNGIGISPEHFDRIFVIFQRLHTRQQFPGTGIGLSICKKIVERHGGKIWVESAPNQGTTFFFTLPAATADATADASAATPPSNPEPARST